MFDFHKDRKRYFDIQVENAEKHVIPFIEKYKKIQVDMKVLEIGAGEGGVLKAFVDKGCIGTAVELHPSRVENGKIWLDKEIKEKKIRFFVDDIYNTSIESLDGPFDIIVLKDVIEHIHDQKRLIRKLKEYLKPNGFIYFGFPPWQMPFGGHQQMGKKSASKLPYIHLLPTLLYKNLLKLFKEPEKTIDFLLETKETGISIERFERIVKETGYKIIGMQHYFLNPIYQWKFGWKPRKQSKIISKTPYIRNYFTTCVYYIIGKEKDGEI